MQNPESWHPTKYIYKNGKLIGSRDSTQVGVGSRLIADLIAESYHRNLSQHARGILLDLGCGKAPLYATYRDLVTDSVCVDWENTAHKNEHLDYEVDLTKTLPFRDEQFDTIILSDVLEHIPVPEHLWMEMARILRRNGNIILSVPFYYWLHEQPHDYYRYTEFALRRFVEISGLRLVRMEVLGGAPEIMADILSKNVENVPKFGHALALIVQWIASIFLATKLGKRVSLATGGNFPLAYFLIAKKPE